MKQPIVRICGPLTTGGLGYEGNVKRFDETEKELVRRGFTLFSYGPSEEYIKEQNIDPDLMLEEFHKPILQSGLIKTAFFLPGWEQSNGATWERNFIKDNSLIEIKEFPEEWL